ncbi:MAG: nitroreductase [Cellvibrionales bacterium]|nr:nitroreductase [Cellvibrionales bacterium]
MSVVLNSIRHRFSDPSMLDDAIDHDQLMTILEASFNANDHGRLKPWRYKVFKGNARQILANAYVKHEQSVGDSQKITRAGQIPFRAPVVITAIASPIAGTKIPRRDQVFSSVAACQLLTLAAWGAGLACIWRTGVYATSDIVKESLGINETEEIVGFIYLGKRQSEQSKSRTTRAIQDHIEVYE